jgi:hypothetical protein
LTLGFQIRLLLSLLLFTKLVLSLKVPKTSLLSQLTKASLLKTQCTQRLTGLQSKLTQRLTAL